MKKLKVLIAEDHAITAKLLSRMLDNSKEIQVVGIASNGYEVLDMVKKKEVDLILLDIMMPFLDGLQVMDKLFKNPATDKIKILVLSVHDEGWIIQKSMAMGASGYISKMVPIGEVIEAIVSVSKGKQYLDAGSLRSLIEAKAANSDNNNLKK